MRNFNEIFGKDVVYDNIKNHKRQAFALYVENPFLEKKNKTGGGGMRDCGETEHTHQPDYLGLLAKIA